MDLFGIYMSYVVKITYMVGALLFPNMTQFKASMGVRGGHILLLCLCKQLLQKRMFLFCHRNYFHLPNW